MTKTVVLVLVIALSSVALDSCKSSKISGETKGTETERSNRPADPGPGISPEHCRLVATLVSIEKIGSENAANPCSKVPCNATIRIEKILGYGSAFGMPLATGAEVRVRFLYTTGPTKELFPDMRPGYPGLSVGARFEADVFGGGEQIGSDESNPRMLLVGSYTIR